MWGSLELTARVVIEDEPVSSKRRSKRLEPQSCVCLCMISKFYLIASRVSYLLSTSSRGRLKPLKSFYSDAPLICCSFITEAWLVVRSEKRRFPLLDPASYSYGKLTTFLSVTDGSLVGISSLLLESPSDTPLEALRKILNWLSAHSFILYSLSSFTYGTNLVVELLLFLTLQCLFLKF